MSSGTFRSRSLVAQPNRGATATRGLRPARRAPRNIGAGLRIGTGLNTGIGRTARIDVAYLFGDGVTGQAGSRWSFSLGPSFVF